MARTLLSAQPLFHFATDRAVLPLKEEQRPSASDDDVFNFSDENRVVTGVLRALQAAFEIRQCSVQNWRAVRSAVKARTGFFLGPRGIAVRLGVVLRNRALIFGEHIDAEAFARVKVSMSPRFLVNAYEHQQGIQRHRTEGICGHSLHFAFVVNRDDGDSGCKAAHCIAKCLLIEGHLRIRFVP